MGVFKVPLSKRDCPEDILVHYCYILRCADTTLYTGYTNDLVKRLKAHNSGVGAKYTKTRLPCEMLYYEEFTDKSSALKREYEIKHRMSRKEKLELIDRGSTNGR